MSSDFVKSAISQAIKEQRKVNARDIAIVVYDFPEDNNDYEELPHILNTLGCR